MNIQYTFALFFLFFSFIIPNQSYEMSTIRSSESYVTGQDGIIRMHVNVIGHVKNPGSHLVYDGIDILSLISTAGGYLEGSNLKKIRVYHTDGTSETVNLDKFFDSNIPVNQLAHIKPNDTIYIDQKMISKIVRSSNLPSIFLSIMNIILTLDRTNSN